MTSAQIRQSFLDFFKSKQHTIVPSSSPDARFAEPALHQRRHEPVRAHLPRPARSARYTTRPRAADTQKCIRAGGKHNDLEDVGLDTYHHTFFEMLGNWSFGDYFKKEAIEWAWELVAEVVEISAKPPLRHRLPARQGRTSRASSTRKPTTLGRDLPRRRPRSRSPHRQRQQEGQFLDDGRHRPLRSVQRNPRRPHPEGDTGGALVNDGTAECIEIWNLVFIQFNANPDGTFSPLPAQHVDTGMGFERVTGIIQSTKNFTDFTGIISNYETDIFRPIFDEIEKLSGKKYGSTLPATRQHQPRREQEKIDVAFRVIADHIRTLSFAIADGIQPGNTDRNYVLRRILRRAVRYGRSLGFHEPFFYKLVDVLAETMGDVFPEIRAKQQLVEETFDAKRRRSTRRWTRHSAVL